MQNLSTQNTKISTTEKVSVNLSAVEIGQIDFLVERGLYDNRTDFIRSSVRKSLEKHEQEIADFVNTEKARGLIAGIEKDDTQLSFAIGVMIISHEYLQGYVQSGKMLNIRSIGLLRFTDDVTPTDIRMGVKSYKCYGKTVASDAVKEALALISEHSL